MLLDCEGLVGKVEGVGLGIWVLVGVEGSLKGFGVVMTGRVFRGLGLV